MAPGHFTFHLFMSEAKLDSRSVKTTESGGPRGYDPNKTMKGRKRQALLDTDGRVLVLDPQGADNQDRDGAEPVLRLSRRTVPFLIEAFGDAGNTGARPETATVVFVESVRKLKDRVGCAVHPCRWGERLFGWISRNRRR